MTLLRRSLIWVLPLLLLLVQHAALAHAVSHLDPDSPGQEKTLVHLKLCGKCVAGEKLSHFSAASAPPLATEVFGYAQPVSRASGCSARFFSRYLSRGPPPFL